MPFFAIRHNTLHHLFALLVALAIALFCWCCWRRGRSYRSDFPSSPPPRTLPQFEARSAASLDHPSVVLPPPHLLPLRLYKHGDQLVKNTECAVCLSVFEADALLTVLPVCNHAYHPPCIDKWLESHKDCPICRTHIALDMSTTP